MLNCVPSSLEKYYNTPIPKPNGLIHWFKLLDDADGDKNRFINQIERMTPNFKQRNMGNII